MQYSLACRPYVLKSNEREKAYSTRYAVIARQMRLKLALVVTLSAQELGFPFYTRPLLYTTGILNHKAMAVNLHQALPFIVATFSDPRNKLSEMLICHKLHCTTIF